MKTKGGTLVKSAGQKDFTCYSQSRQFKLEWEKVQLVAWTFVAVPFLALTHVAIARNCLYSRGPFAASFTISQLAGSVSSAQFTIYWPRTFDYWICVVTWQRALYGTRAIKGILVTITVLTLCNMWNADGKVHRWDHTTRKRKGICHMGARLKSQLGPT